MTSRPRKRLAAVVLAAAVLAPVLGGCGVSGGSSDQEQARAAAVKFFDALHTRDFKTACGLLSETVLRAIPNADKGGCEKVLAKVPKAQSDIPVRIGDVRVREGRATVMASVTPPGQPEASLQILLIKEGGSWKVASRIA